MHHDLSSLTSLVVDELVANILRKASIIKQTKGLWLIRPSLL